MSDRHGFDLVKAMMSGINFNKTVCNVIVKPDGTQGDIKEDHEKYITKCEREHKPMRRFNLTILKKDEDLVSVATEKVNVALTGFKEYRKKRNSRFEKDMKF